MMTLQERMNYEWERFYLDCMRTTKEAIFTKAEEISVKRRICEYLKKKKISESQQEKLASLGNILESCYSYIYEMTDIKSFEDSYIRKWIQQL
ncbi:hypothetical protein M2454_000778 [Aequitasia blattaphilus]|uniref:Uncharacterized protein n=1 Tax=Aequitasia blattaphilus TaxID=2949332 RepID=A0ABT1E839_9FIRM|nr:hypothetical protein [Aequitasia blattaphilus]MCP1101985.1 hypothetical protein [Aequitasia blattaphilus]MCR8614625.1 hypothetical protein [Aequitasia blattaphilus]